LEATDLKQSGLEEEEEAGESGRRSVEWQNREWVGGEGRFGELDSLRTKMFWAVVCIRNSRAGQTHEEKKIETAVLGERGRDWRRRRRRRDPRERGDGRISMDLGGSEACDKHKNESSVSYMVFKSRSGYPPRSGIRFPRERERKEKGEDRP